MTIQEYLDSVLPTYTDANASKASKIGVEYGIRLGMEFAEWVWNSGIILRSDRVLTTEQLFEIFLTEKFK
jgi:hypothetical protein